ncbi:MAG TPA: hypothetical protein PLM75_03540 [bacterium]|nr:hypothetical protein [bacterium]
MKNLRLFVLSAIFVFAFTMLANANPNKEKKDMEDHEFHKGGPKNEMMQELRAEMKDPKLEEVRNKIRILRSEARTIGLKYKSASDADKPKIKQEYRAKISELYDVRIEEMDLRIKAMQSGLEELKKDKNAKIDKLVESNLEKMTEFDKSPRGKKGNNYMCNPKR